MYLASEVAGTNNVGLLDRDAVSSLGEEGSILGEDLKVSLSNTRQSSRSLIGDAILCAELLSEDLNNTGEGNCGFAGFGATLLSLNIFFVNTSELVDENIVNNSISHSFRPRLLESENGGLCALLKDPNDSADGGDYSLG